ncbi:MAG TPA: hypothetical protein VF498_16090 [Anaerolineales bacterium]
MGEDRNTNCTSLPQPETGCLVTTACNGQVRLAADTPRAEFRGQTIYFCLAACKADFERNPATSCMAAWLLDPD